jgi:hypothetical protein
MNYDVKIRHFDHIAEDERGITAAFKLIRQQAEFMFFTRKAGTLSGDTYHAGKNSGTNPKIFILVSGKISLSYRKVNTTNKFNVEVIAPALIEVAPYVVHNIIALADSIFLECNSIADLKSDKIKEIV